MTVRVKICGITSKKALITAINAGADAVGFVVDVPSSPRNLSFDVAKKLIELVPVFVDAIAVTVPKTVNSLKMIFERLHPDGIQIHGEFVSDIHLIRNVTPKTSLIKAINSEISIVDVSSIKDVRSYDAIIIDSHVKGKYGGTGTVHNWELSKRLRGKLNPKPLILAGGLNPNNVEEAITVVHPYAVDVSSGVESSPGIKDPKKIFKFIENAKNVRF